MAGCLYLCKAGFIRLCMHGHVFACMDGDCLFMDDNTLIVPGFPPWRFYSALRLACSWLQLVGFWLQLLLLRVLWPLHPRQLLLVLLCVRLGTLYTLVPLLTIVGFFTVIIFQ